MRKIISILLVVSLVLIVLSMPTYASTISPLEKYFYLKIKNGEIDPSKKPEFLIGDTSFDGKINAEDAMLALLNAVTNSGAYYSPSLSESIYAIYYKNIAKGTSKNNALWYYFECNMGIVGDTDFNGSCDAGDALQILQYAVGKRMEFDRKDYSDTESRRWLVWFDEWYPGMYDPNYPAVKYEGMAWPPPTPTDAG